MFNSINDLESFIHNDKSPLLSAFNEFIAKVIQDKKLVFSSAYVGAEISRFLSYELLNKLEQDDSFELNYESLYVKDALLKYSEHSMNALLPSNLKDAIKFGSSFCTKIREPKVNVHWYGNLEFRLLDYIILYVAVKNKIDLVDFIIKLDDPQEREAEYLNFEMRFCNVLPNLNLNAENLYQSLKYLNNKKATLVSDIFTAIFQIGCSNPQVCIECFLRFKAEKDYELIYIFIIALYKTNPKHYLDEGIELLNESQEHGLNALSRIEYENLADITRASDVVSGLDKLSISALRAIPLFFVKIINNPNSSDILIKIAFRNLFEIISIDSDDQQFRNELVRRVKLIEGYDQEKFKLLLRFLSWGIPQVIVGFFSNFKSPTFLFNLIRQAYTQKGIQVNIKYFESDLFLMHNKFPEEFETELLKLLTDEISAVRFAGLEVMKSKHNDVYSVNLIRLNQAEQEIALKALVAFPINIEGLLPILIQLRDSEFEEIKTLLFEKMIELFNAYNKNLIVMIETLLDLEKKEDLNFIAKIKAEFKKYEKYHELKGNLHELDPYKNEIDYLEKFYRIEQEHQAELMKKISEESFIRTIAKNIRILRGSGFKVEQNDNISMLGTYSTEFPVDRRYFLNPEKYNWELQEFYKPELK